MTDDAKAAAPAQACVIGVDFGTLSARALVLRVGDGAELAVAEHVYRHGVIDTALPGTGERLPPDWALQDPQDWIDALRLAVPAAVESAGIHPADVIGLGTDFTACTVLPVRRDGTPLCRLPEFAARPHAWPKLWKHHAGQPQAERITELAQTRQEPWLPRYGGRISSEWQFAKALQVLDEDPETFDRIERWIEAADWIVWQLCGIETRNPCTAGYKGMFQDGRYPSPEYLAELDHRFADFAATRLEHPLSPLGTRAGGLSAEAAGWTGLSEGIAIAVGNVDAHVTAAAGRAIEPGSLVTVMGTSTCHVVNGRRLVEVAGMCGVVDGGITAGWWGYEAGQSAVGDIFAWWADLTLSAESDAEADEDRHELLTRKAAAQQVGEHGLVALDWMGGNRSILVDHELSGVIIGLTLATRPEDVYRALLEATAFGTRVIIEAFCAAGVDIDEIVVAGGLIKNELLMQIYADVTGRTLSVIGSAQGPALGSAIHAAVAAGLFPDIAAAADVLGRRSPLRYEPDPQRQLAYDALFAEYVRLHEHFGRTPDTLHRLRRIRNEAR